MMKSVLAGIVAVGLVAGLVWFWQPDDAATTPDADSPSSSSTQPATPAPNRTGDAAPGTTPADRQPVAAKQRSDGVPLRVRVLRHPERTPVEGATVTAHGFPEFMRAIARLPPPSTRADRAALRERMSVRATTDAAGLATLMTNGERQSVRARAGTLFGRRIAGVDPKEPVTILVAEDHTLRVRVLTELGDEPVEGIFVSFLAKGSGGSARTDAAGFVEFPHAQTQLLDRDGWHVHLLAPLKKRVSAPVTMDTLRATAPLVLRMPAYGGLHVRVRDENGAPVDSSAVRLHLGVFPTALRTTKSKQLIARISGVSKEGLARSPHLDLGLFLRVTAYPRAKESTHRPVVVDCTGPTHAGETVTCDLTWDSRPAAHYPVVTGRFVRGDGTPWSAAEVTAWPHVFPYTIDYTPSEKVRVDDGGRFRIVLRKPCPKGGKRIYRMHAVVAETGRIECRLDLSRQFRAGTTDLGDVVFDRGALLVKGQVVDDAGNPLPKADVRVCHLVVGKKRDYWPEIDCSGGRALNSKGEFAIHAIPGKPLPTGRLRLRVHCQGLRSTEGPAFQIGATGLRVVLQRTGAIAGSVRLGTGQDATDLSLLVRDGDGKRRPVSMKEDGTFTASGLQPGTWHLTARLRSGDKRIADASKREITGLEVAAGQTCRDPRLQDLEIQGTVQRVTLTFVDQADNPVRTVSIGLLDAKAPYHGLPDSRGRVTLRPDKLPFDAAIRAYGYRELTLRAVRKDRRVVLRRGLAVRFKTDAKTVGKDPKYNLNFFLYHVDDKGHRRRMIYGGATPFGIQNFDGKGRASIVVPRPGVYELQPRIFLSRKDGIGTGGPVPQDQPLRFTVVESAAVQEFDVRISAAALLETVRRYAK